MRFVARDVILGSLMVLVSVMLWLNLRCLQADVRRARTVEHVDTPNDPDEHACRRAVKYKKARNKLSKLLNEALKKHSKLVCDKRARRSHLGTGIRSVSETGGWCRQESLANSTFHAFDKPFARALGDFFLGKSVGSFGDGPGHYKKYLDETRKLKVYDAYDGAPFTDEVSKCTVQFLDLTAPQYGLPVYDWVMSLEVAEHIPAKYEDVYVDNLVRHAREGIILSWATPLQSGFAHVNGKNISEVHSILRQQGFEMDRFESVRLQRLSTLSWLKKNVCVYKRLRHFVVDEDDA